MRLIFFDIDGVFNHEEYYDNITFEERHTLRHKLNDEWGEAFCPISVGYLNHLTDIIPNTKLVCSSSKRHVEPPIGMTRVEYIQKMAKARGITGEIIGVTPSLDFKVRGFNQRSVPRGCEIELFLVHLGFYFTPWDAKRQKEIIEESGIENFIIIDDDQDMLYEQRDHFVHVLSDPNNKSGFNKQYCDEALIKLTKKII